MKLKTTQKTIDLDPFSFEREKPQKTSMITLILTLFSFLSTSSINDQKSKTKKHPQKQPKTIQSQNQFHSFILTLGDSISSKKKRKKRKKKKLNQIKNNPKNN